MCQCPGLSDGTLFAQQKVSGGNTTGKRYCGSFVSTTGTGNTTPQVESVAWDEGRIFADAAGNYHDCWFAGDHLGNIRSVLDITPDVTFPVPLEQNDYLPFGTKISNPLHAQMNTNRWRYAEKEESPDLNLLDFGARMYDPFTARWTAVDPMAGKYTGTSPYVYCANSPMNRIDPFGQRDTSFVKGRDRGIYEIPGTETPISEYRANNSTVYNCHSFAWEETNGDPLDPRNASLVSIGAYRWDNTPDNNMAGFEQLDINEPNKKRRSCIVLCRF